MISADMQPKATRINRPGDCLPLRSKVEVKLSLETRHLGDVIIVHCEGRIVYRDEAAALTRVVTEALQHTRKSYWILKALQRIDSAGLGELVLIRMVAEASGGTLKFAGPNPRIRELLDLPNLSSVFEVHASSWKHSKPATR